MRHARQLLLAAAAILALIVPTIAWAAPPQDLLSADPPDAATVMTGPQQITLIYDQPINPLMTGGYVSDINGAIVSTGVRVSADDPTKIVISLQANLASGWYMVMWNTAPANGDDPLAGMTTFNIA